MYHVLKDLEPVQNNGHNSIYDEKMFVLCVGFWKNSFLKIVQTKLINTGV